MEEKNERFFGEFEYPTREEWKQAAIKALKGAPFEKKMFTKTYEGITLNAIYDQEDIANLPHMKNGFPGFFPFVRGTQASGFKAFSWEVSQRIPYPFAEDFNAAARHDLERGQTGLNIRLDRSATEVGEYKIGCGLNLRTVEDMSKAFCGIDLEKTPVHVDCGLAAPAFAGLLAAYAEKKGIQLRNVTGSLGFDPIGELACKGKIAGEMDKYFDQMAALVTMAKTMAPKFRVVGVNADLYHNGGANAVQEVGYAMSAAVTYLKAMAERGVDISDAANSIRFSFSVGSNFFMEIAKLRSARMIWARIVKEFGGNENAQKINMHVNTSCRNKTKYDPNVNMLRNTTEAISAILGGCDSLHVAYFDSRFGLPEEFSRRVSRNTQLVIGEEAHLTDTADPAAGSWYLESITAQLAEMIWNLFAETEKNGMIESLKSGNIQAEIEKIQKERMKNVSFRSQAILGTNKFANLSDKAIENVKIVTAEEIKKAADNFASFISKRDEAKVAGILAEIKNAGAISKIDEAAAAGATLAEITSALNAAGAGIEVTPVVIKRDAEIFEALRDNANNYRAANGNLPKVVLVNFGTVRDYKGRADFSLDFVQVGGFEAVMTEGFKSIDDAVRGLEGIDAAAYVICSTDDKYVEIVPEFAPKFKSAKPGKKLVLAGFPQDKVEEYKTAGVDEFIHVKANNYEFLSNLQKFAGIC